MRTLVKIGERVIEGGTYDVFSIREGETEVGTVYRSLYTRAWEVILFNAKNPSHYCGSFNDAKKRALHFGAM